MNRVERKKQIEMVLAHIPVYGLPVIVGLLALVAKWMEDIDTEASQIAYWSFGTIACLLATPALLVVFFWIILVFVGIGKLIKCIWDWAWKPRGDEPGAEVKIVPYSSKWKRKDVSDGQS